MNRQVGTPARRCGSIAAFATEALAGRRRQCWWHRHDPGGRHGSWEASVVGDALGAAVGHDEWDLWRHRTEPVTVVLKPERILFSTTTGPHHSPRFDPRREL
jgi:hypothetical protein